MDRKPVESSLLLSLGYDAEAKALEVEFKRTPGTVYRYEDVLPEDHEKLMAAKSLGSHFLKHIKPNRTCSKSVPEKANEDKTQVEA